MLLIIRRPLRSFPTSSHRKNYRAHLFEVSRSIRLIIGVCPPGVGTGKICRGSVGLTPTLVLTYLVNSRYSNTVEDMSAYIGLLGERLTVFFTANYSPLLHLEHLKHLNYWTGFR